MILQKYLIAMAFSLLSIFSCKGYESLDVTAFLEKMAAEPEAQILDVRTAEEFASGHLARAINIDWYANDFLSSVSEALDKDRPVLVYCQSGRRGASAAAMLERSGFTAYNLKGGYVAWRGAGQPATKYEVERFFTAGGQPVDITLIKHGSLEIRYCGLSIQFDPVAAYGKQTDYAKEFPKADVILVTHEHADHLEDATIATLTGDSTVLILNQTSRDRIGRGEVIGNGESRDLPGEIVLEAVPAYNTTPGREMFHPKGNGNGYVLTLDGLRIYVAGDTEDVPEMADLKDIDIAFLPVNQPYTMTPEQCIKAAAIIQPKVLIPYHYSKTDISGIPAALPGIDVRIRQMQ